MPNGRPPIYSDDLASVILGRLSDGESLHSICRDPKMPSRPTVYGWILDDVHGFAAQYARAREIQAHSLADDLLEISDDGSNDWMARNDPENPGWIANGEHLQRSRLRADNRKWLASKILKGQYGDTIRQEHTGADGGPIQVEDAREPLSVIRARAAEKKE